MRMVWRGTISFGLVTIPVRLYVATESKNVPSHQIHVSDGGRVQYKRVCSIDGAEVPYEEIGRGYESATGEIVMLSEVDLAMLPAKTSRSIEVVSFLPMSAVDPIYLDRSYYVEPEPQGAKAYRLLRDALRKQGRRRRRQGHAPRSRDRRSVAGARRCAHPCDHALAGRGPGASVPVPGGGRRVVDAEPGARHGRGADRLACRTRQLDPGRYRDVHRETLTALIDAKATGRTVTQDARPAAASPDLLSALRASIEAAKQRRSTGNGGRRRTAPSTGAAKKKQKKPAADSTRSRRAEEARLTPNPTQDPRHADAMPHSGGASWYQRRHEQLFGLRPGSRPLPRHAGRAR